jgi:hypothetical protein
MAKAAAAPEVNGDHVSAEDLDRWTGIYGTAHRQLRRWIERGRERNDPCPLDTPNAMPAWWARNSRQIVPAKIMTAARAVTGEKSAAPSAHGNSSKSADPPVSTSIDITTIEHGDGTSAITQLRQLRAAQHLQLAEAFRIGQPTELIQSRYLKTGQALRQLEKDEREDETHRSRFVPRETIERDATVLADMLRQFFEFLPRRVEERCAALNKKQRGEVCAAIADAATQCKRIFTNVESLTSPEDFLSALAAA